MSIFQASTRARLASIAGGIIAALPLSASASTYGAGTYNQNVYNAASSPLIAVGPVVLPNTGSTWLALGAAAGVAVLAGVSAWRRGRHSA